jgi:hypothetical protein
MEGSIRDGVKTVLLLGGYGRRYIAPSSSGGGVCRRPSSSAVWDLIPSLGRG